VQPPKTAIVIPCYNEEHRLPGSEFRRFVTSNPFHFVFVNDGSRDGTSGVLAALQQFCPERVQVLDEKVNRGKAEAVRLGICFAIERGYDYVGFWDADLATPLREIPSFVEMLQSRPEIDMVFGARVKLLGRHVERKPARHYLGRVFATFVSTMLGLPIYDTQCGAKLFRVGALGAVLFGEPFLTRWIFDVEIIARYIGQVGPAAAAEGIYEYPLDTWVDVDGSKVKGGDFVTAFVDALRIRRKYLSGPRRKWTTAESRPRGTKTALPQPDIHPDRRI
jgi:glycosyltransferase involved in cell wall biosynthesis